MFEKFKKEFKEKKNNPPLKYPSAKGKSFGVLETAISSFIFFSPNFLFYMPFFRTRIWVFFIYNYFIIFIILSVLSNIKYR